ncbi:hypothetical protein V2J09_016645 [Rumex salicifolius]
MGASGGEMGAENDSSGEEDGDEQWKAAIDSVAAVFSNGVISTETSRLRRPVDDSNDDKAERQPQKLTHFQQKLQKALHGMLDERLEMVRNPINSMDEECPISSEGGVRLFKRAPAGIIFDHVEKLQGPKRKPRIVPGEEVNEKSKKFRKQLHSVSVDGWDVIAVAEDARNKSMARIKSKEAAAKEAAKIEEERVADLKRTRGERWLPSIAKEMNLQLKTSKF